MCRKKRYSAKLSAKFEGLDREKLGAMSVSYEDKRRAGDRIGSSEQAGPGISPALQPGPAVCRVRDSRLVLGV